MSTEIADLRRRLVEFLIQASSQLEISPIVKYSALSLFFDRFCPSVTSAGFNPEKLPAALTDKESTTLAIETFDRTQFAAICTNHHMDLEQSGRFSLPIHDSHALSVKSFKSLGDNVITEQHFMVRDFLEAEVVLLQVLNFEIGTSNIAFVLVEDLYIQFKEVAKVGELLSFEACMDMMDLLYEKEKTSILYGSSRSLAASILVCSYLITVPKQRWDFPVLPWVKFVTSCKEGELVDLVRDILNHILEPKS